MTRQKKYYDANKEKVAKRRREHYQENKERLIDKSVAYKKEHYAQTIESQRKYRQKNRNIIFKKQVEYRAENKEGVKAGQERYYNKHKDKINERQREYCRDNREKVNEQKNEFYHRNKEKINKKRRDEYYTSQCIHLPRDTRLLIYNNVLYIWEVVGELWNDKPIFKIGVTSERLGNQRITQLARKLGYVFKIKLWIRVYGEPATHLERRVHNMLTIIPYMGDIDGKTEFRSCSYGEINSIIEMIRFDEED